jgi:hypothetical protein
MRLAGGNECEFGVGVHRLAGSSLGGIVEVILWDHATYVGFRGDNIAVHFIRKAIPAPLTRVIRFISVMLAQLAWVDCRIYRDLRTLLNYRSMGQSHSSLGSMIHSVKADMATAFKGYVLSLI